MGLPFFGSSPQIMAEQVLDIDAILHATIPKGPPLDVRACRRATRRILAETLAQENDGGHELREEPQREPRGADLHVLIQLRQSITNLKDGHSGIRIVRAGNAVRVP